MRVHVRRVPPPPPRPLNPISNRAWRNRNLNISTRPHLVSISLANTLRTYVVAVKWKSARSQKGAECRFSFRSFHCPYVIIARILFEKRFDPTFRIFFFVFFLTLFLSLSLFAREILNRYLNRINYWTR